MKKKRLNPIQVAIVLCCYVTAILIMITPNKTFAGVIIALLLIGVGLGIPIGKMLD